MVFCAAMFLLIPWVRPFLNLLIRPLGKAVYVSPSEAILVHLKLDLFLSIVVILPYFLWEGWRFVAAGLFPGEKKFFFIYSPFAFLAFCGGASFAFFVVLPLTLRFFMAFGSPELQPMISIGSYVSFASSLLLSFGVIFELPVAVLFLSHLGVVTPSLLVEKWRYVVVFIFVFSAVFTPPDVLSQLLMALPLLALYYFSIFFAHLGSRWRRKVAPLKTVR